MEGHVCLDTLSNASRRHHRCHGYGWPGSAQTKLRWAHVYEVTEPYHTEALWAAARSGTRNGKFDIEVFLASRLGNGISSMTGWGSAPSISFTSASLRCGDPQAARHHRRAVHAA